jgi:hypothetical protein
MFVVEVRAPYYVTLLIYAVKDERIRAEAVYTATRTKWPQGENAKTDELLDKARQTLDDLAADMLADFPADWEEHKADLMEEYIETVATAEQESKEDDAETTAEPAESAEQVNRISKTIAARGNTEVTDSRASCPLIRPVHDAIPAVSASDLPRPGLVCQRECQESHADSYCQFVFHFSG